jgi:hypothetical protein
MHHDHAKPVIIPLYLHALGIIDVQVDIERWWILRRRIGQAVHCQGAVVQYAVDHTVNADAI